MADDEILTCDVSPRLIRALKAEGYSVRELSGSATYGWVSQRCAVVGIPDSLEMSAGIPSNIRARGFAGPLIGITESSTDIDHDEDREIAFLRAGGDRLLFAPVAHPMLLMFVTVFSRRERNSPGVRSHETEHVYVARGGRVRFSPAKQQLSIDSQPARLTKSQLAIVEALLERPGVTKSRDQLARAYGETALENVRKIDAHMKRIRIEIRAIAPDLEGLFEAMYGVGYKAIP